jgi:hypothetical protein
LILREGLVGVVVFGSLVAMMGGLIHLLGQERDLALAVVSAAVDEAKAGAHPCEGLAEAAGVEAALRDTSRVRVKNFLVQAETACYSVVLVGDRPRSGSFLYRVEGPNRALLDVSLGRTCACPDLDLGPCTLR